MFRCLGDPFDFILQYCSGILISRLVKYVFECDFASHNLSSSFCIKYPEDKRCDFRNIGFKQYVSSTMKSALPFPARIFARQYIADYIIYYRIRWFYCNYCGYPYKHLQLLVLKSGFFNTGIRLNLCHVQIKTGNNLLSL